MSCLVSPSWDEEVTTSKSEFLHSIIEHNEVLEVNGWAPKFEPLPPIEDRALPSEERPSILPLNTCIYPMGVTLTHRSHITPLGPF